MMDFRKGTKGFWRGEKGQSLVEMALILPLILLLFMGIIEFGRVFNAYLTVNQGAREGARVGVVGGSDSQIEARVLTVTSPSLDADRVEVNIDPPQGSRTRGGPLEVEVAFPVEIQTPIISNFLGQTLTVRAQSTMRVE